MNRVVKTFAVLENTMPDLMPCTISQLDALHPFPTRDTSVFNIVQVQLLSKMPQAPAHTRALPQALCPMQYKPELIPKSSSVTTHLANVNLHLCRVNFE